LHFDKTAATEQRFGCGVLAVNELRHIICGIKLLIKYQNNKNKEQNSRHNPENRQNLQQQFAREASRRFKTGITRNGPGINRNNFSNRNYQKLS